MLIADDQHLVRTGLRVILGSEPDIEVIDEASNGREAISIAREQRPDVAMLDIRTPDLDGIEATRQIVAQSRESRTRVLTLTAFDLDEYVVEARRAGATGFLLKDVPAHELASSARMIAAGDALLAATVTRRLIDNSSRQLRPLRHHPACKS